MKDNAVELRKIAEGIRAAVEESKVRHIKEASVAVKQETLDSKHVVNFLKFFGA